MPAQLRDSLAFGAVEVFRMNYLEFVDNVLTLDREAGVCVCVWVGEVEGVWI